MLGLTASSNVVPRLLGILSVVILIGSLSACEPPSEYKTEQSRYVEDLEWIMDADPREDFEQAIMKSDYRFMALYGITLSIPGLMKECLNVDTDTRPIDGTSEILYGYEHEKLMAVAHVYAGEYNSLMRRYLEETNGFVCDASE